MRLIITTLTVVLGVSAALAAGADGPGEIRWRTGAMSAPAESPRQAAARLREMAPPGSLRRVIVQFDEPITPEQRLHLGEAGVDLLSPLGRNGFFAAIDGDALEVNRVAQINRLRLAQPAGIEFKLHRAFIDEQVPEWAIVGGSEPPCATRPPGAGDAIVAAQVLFHRDVSPERRLELAAEHGAFVRSQLQTVPGLLIEAPLDAIIDLAGRDDVQWIEPPLPPLTPTLADVRPVIQADAAQAPPYDLAGEEVIVMVFDAGTALATHPDFGGRLTINDASGLSNHATHVSGIIGGDGTLSDGELRGMAPGATMLSYGFQWTGGIFFYTDPGTIEQDYADAINNHDAVLANNSLGTNVATNGFPCEITGEYGVASAVIDGMVRGSLGEPIAIVWANGNERQSSNCGDTYYTTAPPACAKNHITIGAINADDESVTSFTSWGPCNDGRIKPDLVTPGCKSPSDDAVVSTSASGGYTSLCGTSMSAPAATGAAALLLEEFRSLYPGSSDPLPATVRALLIHTAKDLETTGPDFMTGYGVIQIADAIDFMQTGSFQEPTLSQDDVVRFFLNITEPGQEIKATLVWDDPPAAPNVEEVLVNDLDVQVIGPDGVFYPFTLDPENPAAPAVQDGPDRRNNIEQVIVADASPGLWLVEVIGHSVPEGPQPFSIAAGPSLVGTGISFPDGLPEVVAPGVAEPLLVRIVSTEEVLVPGSPALHYRLGEGSFTSVPLEPLPSSECSSQNGACFQAPLPPAGCGGTIEYYISAEGSFSGTVTSPSAAPASVHAAPVGFIVLAFEDDFDDDLGWVVGAPDDDAISGIWELADPIGTFVNGIPVQPGAPYAGAACYITGQHAPGGGAGANDVDHGKTTLISPTLDLSSALWATVTYRRWYSNSAGANPNSDVFVVDVSADDGETWVNAETVGPAGSGTSGGWIKHTFYVEDLVPLTDTVRVRFVASDEDPQALVEAAVDAFRLYLFVCEAPTPQCPGDLTGNGEVGVNDLLLLLISWGPCSGAECPADLTGNSAVDVDDLMALLALWGVCE